MKQWFQSKTMWFNFGTLVTLSGVGLAYLNDFGLDPKTTAMIGFGLSTFQAVGNAYLRSITSKAIGTPTDGGFEDPTDGAR